MKSWVLKEGGRFVKVIELSSQAREQTLTANGLQAISAGGERLCFEHQKIKMATLRGLSCKTSNQSYFWGRSRLLNFVSFFGQQDTAITSASHPLRRFADVLWPKICLASPGSTPSVFPQSGRCLTPEFIQIF